MLIIIKISDSLILLKIKNNEKINIITNYFIFLKLFYYNYKRYSIFTLLSKYNIKIFEKLVYKIIYFYLIK